MIKLRLKRCGRKQRATWWMDQLWVIIAAFIFYIII